MIAARDAALNIQAEQYSQRERQRILREEPDSLEAVAIRAELAAEQKQRDEQIAAREAQEAEEQRLRDEAAQAELARAQGNLSERQNLFRHAAGHRRIEPRKES